MTFLKCTSNGQNVWINVDRIAVIKAGGDDEAQTEIVFSDNLLEFVDEPVEQLVAALVR